MRLSAKILKNVTDINHWQYAAQAIVSQGQPNTIYIQLVDLEYSFAPEKSEAFPEFPIRYISNATAISVSALFESLVDSEEFEVNATQPFANDRSIWAITIPSDQLPQSGSLTITVTEDAVEKTFIVKQAITVEQLNIGGC